MKILPSPISPPSSYCYIHPKMFRTESIETFPNDHNLLKIPTSLRQFHIIKMALKWEFWAMRKCEYLRTPYTRLRRICPRHVSPVPVLCGERMAGKLADSPTTLCGNPILGHIEINGRAVVVEVSAASHDVRYLSWEGGLVAMATRWAGSLESIWVGAKRQITSISFTLATLPLDHGWMPPLYCPSHLFWQTVTEWSLCGAHIINTPRGKHDHITI